MKKVSDNLFIKTKVAATTFQMPPFILFSDYVNEVQGCSEDEAVAQFIIQSRNAESCEQGKIFMSKFKVIDLPF